MEPRSGRWGGERGYLGVNEYPQPIPVKRGSDS